MRIKSSAQIPDSTFCGLRAPRRGHVVLHLAKLPGFVSAALLLCGSFLLISCQEHLAVSPTGKPIIEFTGVPTAGQFDAVGNAAKVSTIKGRVLGAQPGEEIVLYPHASKEAC